MQWSRRTHLTTDLQALLLAEDVDTVSVLSTLQEVDVAKFKLSIGKHRLMCAWLTKLKDKAKTMEAEGINKQPVTYGDIPSVS